MKSQSYLPALQVFRAIAASVVVFHHLWNEFRFAFSIHSTLMDHIASDAKYGVDFFFVLSGFIICYAHFDKKGIWSEAGGYLTNRVLRIYLPYLPVSLLMLCCYRYFPYLPNAANPISWVKSITLLPVSGETALSVAWTLVFEMFFYMVFVLFFLPGRFFLVVMIVWVLCIAAVGLGVWVPRTDFQALLVSPYNLEFIGGFCAATLVKRLSPGQIWWVAIGLPIAIGILWIFPSILNGKVLLGLFFVTLILWAIRSPLNRLSRGSVLMVLGNASYSIYLIHVPEISLAMRVFPKTGNGLYVVILGVSIFVLTLCTGVLYSRVFEQWLLSKVKARLKPKVMSKVALGGDGLQN